LAQAPGFTFNHVEEHGVQVENSLFLSARGKAVGYTPRVKVDILLEDSDVGLVLDALRKETNGMDGEVLYWVDAVEEKA